MHGGTTLPTRCVLARLYSFACMLTTPISKQELAGVAATQAAGRDLPKAGAGRKLLFTCKQYWVDKLLKFGVAWSTSKAASALTFVLLRSR